MNTPDTPKDERSYKSDDPAWKDSVLKPGFLTFNETETGLELSTVTPKDIVVENKGESTIPGNWISVCK